jgi:hypothetical protein
MSRKWGFGRKQDAADPAADVDVPASRSEPETSTGQTDGDWWLGATEPTKVINRRWRAPKPGSLHPRRRETDRATPTASGPPTDPDHFDPDALFDTIATGPTANRPADVPSHAEPWTTLGLTSDATWDQVVVRHRDLAKEHHPDRAGPDEVDTRAAADRMASINAAFAELGKIYRLSGDR